MSDATLKVSCAVIQDGEHFLITKRPRDRHLAGLWEFPGGKVKPCETPEMALHREIAEELGIEIRIERKLDEKFHTYPEKRLHLFFFLCQIETGQAKPQEGQKMSWIRREQFQDYTFPAADQQILKVLIRGN